MIRSATVAVIAAAATAASAAGPARPTSSAAAGCGLRLPPPRFGEPLFRVPKGGSAQARQPAPGGLICVLRRADGIVFARAYRDAGGRVLEVAFYRASGALLEDEDELVAASRSAQARPLRVTCGSSTHKSIGPAFWRTPYVWRLGRTVPGIAPAKIVRAVRAGVSEWVNNRNWCGIRDEANVPARYAGRTSAAAGHDGKNVVDWGSLRGDQACKGALACAQTWYGPKGQPLESDIRFNTADAWAVGRKARRYDIQSTAAHEFGHVFQFDHVTSLAARGYTLVMWPYLGQDDTSAHRLGCGDALADNRYY